MHALLPITIRFLTTSALALGAFCIAATLVPSQRHACHATAVSPAPVVEAGEFGIDHWVEGEGYVFTETDHVHLTPGTSFGWRLQLRHPVETVLLREEFVLPTPPAYWGLGPDTRLSQDRTVAVTERWVRPEGRLLANQWTVTDGDPAGPYEMRVFLDGELARVFQFQAEAVNAHPHADEGSYVQPIEIIVAEDDVDDSAPPQAQLSDAESRALYVRAIRAIRDGSPRGCDDLQAIISGAEQSSRWRRKALDRVQRDCR